ncbi:HAD superfamily hydrolase (TIGR01549 family) [Kitasatospora sp. MAA4]|uniref:HAD family hydrolase n=1 Tax=Kitasatospora sp. MAA4 TaxID=3035093 RepID=UPI0024739914|nr:HAD family hydrolase [Kitasatospora sp. MAA4]MDH6137126.1 HAD superfamily hydrolase (TIGR01549 family) [Kitasatospora sp. MAA4]
MTIRAVVFDIGETLTSDTRYWRDWADWLGVPPHTMSALVGAVIAQELDNAEAIRRIKPGCDVPAEWDARRAAGCDEYLDETDLYPDVRPALQLLCDAGIWVGIAGNQNARVNQLLRGLQLPADAIATSAEWGIAKPAAGFFEKVAAWAPGERHEIVYVGDHPANDITPARAAGLRTAHLRRGPIGHLRADHPEATAADWCVNSLTDLADHLTAEQ